MLKQALPRQTKIYLQRLACPKEAKVTTRRSINIKDHSQTFVTSGFS
jgi:hypothetical protein